MIQRLPWNRLESAAQRKWLKIKGRSEDELPPARQLFEASVQKSSRISCKIAETVNNIRFLKQSGRKLEIVTKRYAAIVSSVSRTAERVRCMVRQAMPIVVNNIAVTNELGSLTQRQIRRANV